ncbi:MAG: CPBP family intramembrane metalloprotease [Alphaproteobacteria bacterium]|nr:CPBP family intramembrane metalloprotease [Alphaproteobacteria bacterium]
MNLRKRTCLLVEFLALFVGAPLAILYFRQRELMFLVLWMGAIGLFYYIFRTKQGFTYLAEWNWRGAMAGLKAVLGRFVLLMPFLVLFSWWHRPEYFFTFPIERPQMWAAVMLFYPLLSVWPQEIIYRSFVFHRYEPAFPDARYAVGLSALSFGFMHVMFGNWIAVVLTVLGGFLIARTYRLYRSLALVCIEHALYGCLVFTIGLGAYFYSGSAWGR